MPQLEEVSDDDIDNMDMDLAQFDPNLKTHIAPKVQSIVTKSSNYEDNVPSLLPQDLIPPSFNPNGLAHAEENMYKEGPMLVDPEGNPVKADGYTTTTTEQMKLLQVIYPCYFDVNRSHKQGRRVPKELAIANPLAKSISDICIRMGLKTILEPDKSHPQDFGNPGRVRVLIKEDHKAVDSQTENKRVLIKKIAYILKDRPTTLESVKQLRIPNFDPQLQSDEFKPSRIPKVKGFKMNDIVPLHSPLLMGHPQLKAVYTKDPVVESSGPTQPVIPQMPKKKVLKVRR